MTTRPALAPEPRMDRTALALVAIAVLGALAPFAAWAWLVLAHPF